ncbi:MAG: signal peptidase I [Abditibacteriaceae bacterium]
MPNEVKILEDEEVRPTSAKIITATIEALVILMGVVLILIVRTYWLETAVVISGSMKPTLQVGCRLAVDHRAALHGTWKRDDIVVFTDPPNWPPDTYIKRIIAVPGDMIQIYNGVVILNGKVLSEPFIAGKSVRENYGPWKMGPRQYFMMGDNRNHSEDSRDHGPVTDKDIHGRAIFQLWPLSSFGKLH